MSRHTFVSPPSVSLADDATIELAAAVSTPTADVILHCARGERPFGIDVLALFLTTDAAILLRDKLTEALAGEPGTSKPAGAA